MTNKQLDNRVKKLRSIEAQMKELVLRIARDMDEKIKEAGASWGTMDRITWAVKEAFILGSLNMAETMMAVNDMGYNAIAGEGAEA